MQHRKQANSKIAKVQASVPVDASFWTTEAQAVTYGTESLYFRKLFNGHNEAQCGLGKTYDLELCRERSQISQNIFFREILAKARLGEVNVALTLSIDTCSSACSGSLYDLSKYFRIYSL